jgi:hypothetical protein
VHSREIVSASHARRSAWTTFPDGFRPLRCLVASYASAKRTSSSGVGIGPTTRKVPS